MANTSRGIWYPSTNDTVRPASRDFKDVALTTNAAIDAAVSEATPYKGNIADNDDLNDYTESGVWRRSSGTGAGSIQNRPDGSPINPFRVEVFQLSPTITHQVFTVGLSGDLFKYERYRFGSTWFPWKAASQETTVLTSNADLNALTETGSYLSTAWSIGSTVSNRPPNSVAQPFIVDVVNVNGNVVHQTYTEGNSGHIYRWRRYHFYNNWNAWRIELDTTQPTGGGGTGERKTDRTSVTLFGDSQLDGTPVSTAVQDKLGSAVTVTNRGRGGDTVDQVLLRAGAKEYWFTVAGGQIPASGSVSLTTAQPFDTGRDRSFSGSIAGVAGTLQFTAADRSWSFTRAGSGSTTPAEGLQQFVSAQAGTAHHTLVAWMGGNNTWENGDYLAPDIESQVISAHQMMMLWAAPQKHVLLPGMTYGLSTASGANERKQLADQVNTWLAEHYPTQFCNVNQWLINHGMTAAGLTDTPDDIDARAAGLIPPSLLADEVHFKPEVREAIGTYLAEQLRKRGWA